MNQTQFNIELGEARKPHGLKGHTELLTASGQDCQLRDGQQVLVRPLHSSSVLPQNGQIMEVAEVKVGQKIRLLLKGVIDRTHLEKLLPFSVWVRREDFEELTEDQFYVVDLLGLKAQDEQGNEVGVIHDWYEIPGQITLVVKLQQGGLVELPFVKSFFPQVNVSGGYVQIVLPEVME